MKRVAQAVSLPFLLLLALALLTVTIVAPWSVWQPGKAAQTNAQVSGDDDFFRCQPWRPRLP